ncbi:hypothetical protein K458DRAFT_413570 [Lentithecium fluviatile CBS 122367]|uniref:MARVEL domain-containing protein n=1 Tax=Lentithecium fluviatile CBS 122367 TaxID=1168545 RepID=A0A6G1JGH2_9PLEO|nr:hypothetical protein K458DRAFT_413570 [Lentithecium fluviatile CBS 122367]
MAAFSSIDTEIPARGTSRTPPPCFKKLKYIWALQGIIALPRLYLIAFISLIMFWMFMFTPGLAIVIWLFCAIDLVMTLSIILTVVRQYHNKETATAAVTFRREAMKAAFATYLWLWALFTDPKRVFKPEDSQSGLDPKAERTLVIINIYLMVLTVVVILVFYPSVWLAYRDWRAEREAKRCEDVEFGVAGGEEDRIRLLDRSSIDDILGDLIEDDDSKIRKF